MTLIDGRLWFAIFGYVFEIGSSAARTRLTSKQKVAFVDFHRFSIGQIVDQFIYLTLIQLWESIGVRCICFVTVRLRICFQMIQIPRLFLLKRKKYLIFLHLMGRLRAMDHKRASHCGILSVKLKIIILNVLFF